MSDFLKSLSSRDSKFCERYKTVDTAYTTTGTKTISITSGTITAGLRDGFVRIRTKSVNASSTNQFEVQATDGTTTNELLATTAATAAGVASELVIPFSSDTAYNQFSLTVVLAGNGNETVDFEIVGCR